MRYVSPDCAAFAVDRLHGFEYPIGFPLSVSFAKPGLFRSTVALWLCCVATAGVSSGGERRDEFGMKSQLDRHLDDFDEARPDADGLKALAASISRVSASS